MERLCSRPRVHHFTALMSAVPTLEPTVVYGLWLLAGLAWPLLMPFKALARLVLRDRPRGEHCGLPATR